jgi:hypothetical protein
MEWSKLSAAPPPDFPDLRPAEIRLLRALRGEAGGADVDADGDVVIGGDLPAVGDVDRAIRAGLIAFLARGGDDRAPTSDRGLRIAGAWIDRGALNLEGAELRGDLMLVQCRFDQAPILLGAACASISLNGAVLPGLKGDRLRCSGGLFMLNGFTATGEVRLLGARIGGDLDCDGATLDGGGRDALNADGVQVTGSVFLNGGFTATGTVRLPGAQIGGNLECVGATLNGGGGYALNADGVQVTGAVFLRDGFTATGAMDFTEARIGAFADELACWPTPGDGPGQGKIGLVGCVYGGVHSEDWDASSRLDWLSRCTIGPGDDGFHPQPYEQLAKVFRDSGHPEDARIVMIEKERLQRASGRNRSAARGGVGPVWAKMVQAWDWSFDVSVRYGHQPLRAFLFLAGFAVFGTGLFYQASQSDAIKPNSAVVLRAPEWSACAVPAGSFVHDRRTEDGTTKLLGRAKPHESQRDCFERQPEAASWPEFNAFVYSLDTLLPIVDLEMQTYWIPDEDKNGDHWWDSFGWWARTYLWIQIAMGWALSLLAVAGFSGLVKSD